ncbi:MAG: LPS export ABC transporter periplasmic protein LptC [Candidatus Kuenenia sp.]|nr:LPS export ABC transporter periplasmic protein LptC [Candidatus Kuenenia hertensis]
MTKRRYIFLGIPIVCLIAIIVSVVLSKPESKNPDEKPGESLVPQEDSLKNKRIIEDIRKSEKITQTVDDLFLPNYNKEGNETFVMRGRNTFLLENDRYKIIEPEIEVMDDENPENEAQKVIITSDIGEMDKTSNEGYLSDNVVVHLDQETRLCTENMRYLPEKRAVQTDEFVTITRTGLVITGKGCEIDLVNRKMWIKKDAEMEMDGVKNDLFFISEEEPGQDRGFEEPDTGKIVEEEKTGEKTTIRSSGPLVFDRKPDSNIMTFNDNVEVKKGSSTVFSDKLVIFLDAETKKTKQAIASGNVLASEGAKIAKGDTLSWDVNTQSAILEDARKAEFIRDDLSIDALKMIFYKTVNKINVPTAGSLKVTPKEKDNQEGKPAKAKMKEDTINVKWDGKMNYFGDTREASFEKNIEVRRADSILRCDNLNVTFNNDDYDLKTLDAKERVHIIDKKGDLFSEAVGDQVAWNVSDKVTVLYGNPFAILREGNKRQIISPKVSFFENEEKIVCEGKGSLYEIGKGMHRAEEKEGTGIKVVWVNKMEYDEVIKKASFFEEVEVSQRGQRLSGDQVDAYMGPNGEISKIITAGNVYFYSEDLGGSEGFGSFFTWDLAQNMGVLTGNPKAELRKEGSRTFSEKVYFDMTADRITWEGRPHWQLISKESGNADK